MDPVSLAITAALSRGIVNASYEALKTLIRKKLGENSRVIKSIENLEAEPDSQIYRVVFQQEIASSKLDEDLNIRVAADVLLADVIKPTIGIRVTEDPLTAKHLTTIISALTELSTKYWLIAKGRFADLIEYTQTHNGRFAEEAHAVITKVSYNSPFNMDWKVDLSAPSVAEALVTTIDGITQAPQRLKQKELENQAKTQEIQQAEQQAAHEQQMALLEREQRRLEIEKQRLEILEKQLEVQKKGIEYALEIAGKVVDLLHPSADPATRAMEIQALLPNLVQLQNGKGLELALPLSHNEQSTAPKEG